MNAISSGQALWKMYKCGLIPDRCTAKRQGNCFNLPPHSLLHGRLRLQRWGWRRLGCLPCLESRCCGTGDGVSPSGSGHGHAVSGRRGSALGVALGFCRGEWGAGWESCRDRAVLAGTCCPGWRLLSGRRSSSAVYGLVRRGGSGLVMGYFAKSCGSLAFDRRAVPAMSCSSHFHFSHYDYTHPSAVPS